MMRLPASHAGSQVGFHHSDRELVNLAPINGYPSFRVHGVEGLGMLDCRQSLPCLGQWTVEARKG